jgi:hypothetical protein
MAEETGLEPASPKAAVFKTAALPIMLLLQNGYFLNKKSCFGLSIDHSNV